MLLSECDTSSEKCWIPEIGTPLLQRDDLMIISLSRPRNRDWDLAEHTRVNDQHQQMGLLIYLVTRIVGKVLF